MRKAKEAQETVQEEQKAVKEEIKVSEVPAQAKTGIDQDKDEYTLQIIDDESYRIDITHLEKQDPNYAYRWLKDEHKNLTIKTSNALYQKGGWQLVPKKHVVEKLGISESEISPDGWYRRGDTILARMPKELFEKKEAYKFKKANAPMDAIQRMIKEGDSSVGRDIHSTMKGIQTKEALKGNWKE